MQIGGLAGWNGRIECKEVSKGIGTRERRSMTYRARILQEPVIELKSGRLRAVLGRLRKKQ